MIRAYVASVCACAVVAASVAFQSAQASEDLNVSYISKDAVAAVVVHPRRLITSPDLEMLPVELPVALGMDMFGIDLTEVEQAIGIVSLGGPAAGPRMGAVLHFAKPYDQDAAMSKLSATTDEATHAGKKYRKAKAPQGFSVYMPDERTMVIADIPGLIEGASEGAGLGHQFLRHVERCRVLLHIVEATFMTGPTRAPVEDFDVINRELALHAPELAQKPQVVALNKLDATEPEKIAEHRAAFAARGIELLVMSAATGEGIGPILEKLWGHVVAARRAL